MSAVQSIFFLPPLAIARIGGSDVPLDNFVWGSDPTIHGSHRTVIRPAVSLEVLADGSLRPYWPSAIQFRDQGRLRPVAPFFELWAKLQDGTCRPLTSTFLAEQNASLDSVEYTVIVANRKAQRRTGFASCAYIAQVIVSASDYQRKPLLAYSPHNSGQEPLVLRNHPISLGHFQVIKPIARVVASNIHLGVLRARFTPARGEVYGPPTAIVGPASPLPPGVALAGVTLGGRLHEIVPPDNRILNPNTPWSRYIMDRGDSDPQPSDSYDGANVGLNRSWGVVDDTCDGTIEAQVVIGNRRFVAAARIFSSCPDYAPDRRPFYSVADDLADRDLPLVPVDGDTLSDTQHEIADLFERAFETGSLYNLDAMRERAVAENIASPAPPPNSKLPKIDWGSMTAADENYADITADFFAAPKNSQDQPDKVGVPGLQLPYAAMAQFKHASLCDTETLLDLLMAKGTYVKRLVRPPFGRIKDLPERPAVQPNPAFRDARVARDGFHDMRMPPYMRDSDLLPLSITYRQHDALKRLIDELGQQQAMLGDRLNTPITRRIVQLTERQQRGDSIPKPKDTSAALAAAAATTKTADQRTNKIFPRNLTALAAYLVPGNPVVTRAEDAVANCFPGLELDVRNLDRRFFPGLVFEFVDDGARLAYVDARQDPDLSLDPETIERVFKMLDAEIPRKKGKDPKDVVRSLIRKLYGELTGTTADTISEGTWYLEWIEQGGKRLSMHQDGEPMNNLIVWRLVRSLEPGLVTIGLRRRDEKAKRRRNRSHEVKFAGWRRRYTNEETGVLNGAYQPGELMQGLCSPWQHDFRDCQCFYWAANHPDVVLGELYPGEASPPDEDYAGQVPDECGKPSPQAPAAPRDAAGQQGASVPSGPTSSTATTGTASAATGPIGPAGPTSPTDPSDGRRVAPEGEPILANFPLDWIRADRSRALGAEALRTIAQNRPYQLDHFAINRAWQDLSIVLEGREIGGLYVPQNIDKANPYNSPEELAAACRDMLAPLELTLTFEYLYARFSLLDQDTADQSGIPLLGGAVRLARDRLMLIATSEMQHLRWANQILWELYQRGRIPSYEPVLVLKEKEIPTSIDKATKERLAAMSAEDRNQERVKHFINTERAGDSGVRKTRDAELRPLTEDVIDDFIAVEHPSGLIDGAYARVIATLRQDGYPNHAAELALRIAGDGVQHEIHFLEIKAALSPFFDPGPNKQPAYLRELQIKNTLKNPGRAEPALTHLGTIKDNLVKAYTLAGNNKIQDTGVPIANARTAMKELLELGEVLAKDGIGIPFFDFWKSPR